MSRLFFELLVPRRDRVRIAIRVSGLAFAHDQASKPGQDTTADKSTDGLRNQPGGCGFATQHLNEKPAAKATDGTDDRAHDDAERLLLENRTRRVSTRCAGNQLRNDRQ
jgi:hypothetical protein